MERRIEEYSIGQLAQVAGISLRTLRHYDAINLLKPAYVADNGYRYYGRAEALRLQEILFYRATGMALADIAALLASGNALDRLTAHRNKIAEALQQQAAALATLDRTIAHLKGTETMTIEELYKPFTAEKQAKYEDWLIETYGPEMAKAIEAAQLKETENPAVSDDASMENLRSIEADLVADYEAGIAPKKADLLAHQKWVSGMWNAPCDNEAYAGLADLYLSHPDFIARYETLSEGFSQWLTSAMKAWSARQTG